MKTCPESCVIGTDFDNTLVNYDVLFRREAIDRGFFAANSKDGKKSIRDKVRQSPGGDGAWQRLQAVIYGKKVGEAPAMPGARDFFRRCAREGVAIYVISHKTEFAELDGVSVDLRAAAFQWLIANCFFDVDGYQMKEADVFFEPTRAAKLARIGQLGCTHFIDDLEETFLDGSFPSGVKKLLFDLCGENTRRLGVQVVRGWRDLDHYFFDHAQH
jgi:hypothetical protein